MRMTKRKHVVIVDTGFRRLIYPLDSSFIKDLDPKRVNSWIETGWSIDKTVMLEIDYPTIPEYRSPEGSVASNIFSGIIYAWNTGKYYRIVTFSKRYFEEVDEFNRKVEVYHEGLHLRSYEDSLLTGSRPLTEDDVARAEVEYVRKTYGNEGFAARGRHILTNEEEFKKADAIAGVVALLWLREYFEEEQARYSPVSFSIPSNSEFVNSIRKTHYSMMIQPVTAFYRAAFNLDPSLIFRHCLKKINLRNDSPE